MTRVAVARTKYAVGFPSDKGVPFAYQVLDIHEALERRYTSDAHLVTYLADGLARQQRVNKPGLAAYPHTLRIECFFADVDNPGHALWTDETLAEARASDPHHEALATTGLYYTSAGRRIVQPLEKPILAGEAEPYIKAWLTSLEAAGLAVDHNCRDWTRHFRLPYVRREGLKHTQIPDCLDLSRMRPVVPPEPTENAELAACLAQPSPRRPRDVYVGAWTTELPDVWREMAERLAAAIREVHTEWHSLFMILAGALLGRRVPPERVPALCHAVSRLTGQDDRAADRVVAAQSTVARWRLNFPLAGYASLAERWPTVAAALDEAVARGREAELRAQVGQAPVEPTQDVSTITQALEDTIRNAPYGLTLIQAGCGLGKTRAAERVAAERAAKTHADPEAKSDRAPFNSKTALAVDKHALAEQVVEHLVQLRTPAQRHFGALALKEPDGTPVCKLADVARPLVAGGQRMRWLLCDGQGKTPCEFADGCRAKDGVEGPDGARVQVGPHALMGRLGEAAGSTGMLILDEPPSLLETYSFTLADLATAERHLHAFETDYVRALRPALDAFLLWARHGVEAADATTVREVVRTNARTVPLDVLEAAQSAACLPGNVDIEACVQHAPMPPKSPPVPPIAQAWLARARKDAGFAARVGLTSRLLAVLQHGLDRMEVTDPSQGKGDMEVRVAARIEDRGRRRTIHLTQVNEQFHRALRRDGTVVVLDANADVHAPVFAAVHGGDVEVRHFDAPDGAPIDRVVHYQPSATRTAWLKEGKLRLTPTLVRSVKTAVDFANEQPGNGVLAIVAIRVVELALRVAFDPADADAAQGWADAGQDHAALVQVRKVLGPILAQWKGRILFGHYGALRGLDHMAEADCLVTIGDPWINIEQARHEAAFLGIASDWDNRLRALCRAELEQAHGRLRTVHRTRPGRAMHIGDQLPSGVHWASATVRRHPLGRRKASSPAAEKP